jgi:hypothetical protein
MRGRGSCLRGKELGQDDGMEVRDENVLEKKSREGSVPGVRSEERWLEKNRCHAWPFVPRGGYLKAQEIDRRTKRILKKSRLGLKTLIEEDREY